jgi:hypothetical protein
LSAYIDGKRQRKKDHEHESLTTKQSFHGFLQGKMVEDLNGLTGLSNDALSAERLTDFVLISWPRAREFPKVKT